MSEAVTPCLEWKPERTYEHDGSGEIICYSIPDNKKPGEELFRIKLSKENAALLMNDLYYGEYTGS